MPVVRTLLASLGILAAGAAALGFATDGLRAFTSETARRLDIREHPRTVPPALSLEAADGTHTDFAALRGRWLLVSFIYTRCPTYCSVLGAEFAQLQRDLAREIHSDAVQLLSVSFDPAYDTPTKLADYRRRFGASGAGWLVVRPADRDTLGELLRVFGVIAVPDGRDGFVHNAAIEIVDPRGRLVMVFDPDDPRGAAAYLRRNLDR